MPPKKHMSPKKGGPKKGKAVKMPTHVEDTIDYVKNRSRGLQEDDFENIKRVAMQERVKPKKIDGVPRMKEDWIKVIVAVGVKAEYRYLKIDDAIKLVDLIWKNQISGEFFEILYGPIAYFYDGDVEEVYEEYKQGNTKPWKELDKIASGITAEQMKTVPRKKVREEKEMKEGKEGKGERKISKESQEKIKKGMSKLKSYMSGGIFKKSDPMKKLDIVQRLNEDFTQYKKLKNEEKNKKYSSLVCDLLCANNAAIDGKTRLKLLAIVEKALIEGIANMNFIESLKIRKYIDKTISTMSESQHAAKVNKLKVKLREDLENLVEEYDDDEVDVELMLERIDEYVDEQLEKDPTYVDELLNDDGERIRIIETCGLDNKSKEELDKVKAESEEKKWKNNINRMRDAERRFIEEERARDEAALEAARAAAEPARRAAERLRLEEEQEVREMAEAVEAVGDIEGDFEVEAGRDFEHGVGRDDGRRHSHRSRR